MIDLHIHSNNSDGSDKVEEILKKAEERSLHYISITDHDNCDAYDVLKKINVSKSPLNWFTGSSDFVNERYGCVSHGELGNNITFFNSHSPFIADTKVACIDGLCIILTKKVIEETDLLFDERFKFDHYDTDFSFECTLKRKLNLGVIVRDDLMHWSVGKSILTQSFLESEKHFREKWQFQVN